MLAESDDELSSLAIPADEPESAPSPQEDTKSGIDPLQSSEPQAEAPLSSKGVKPDTDGDPPADVSKKTSAKPKKQSYPLYPSIVQLLHEKGLSAQEANEIPASGPKGRLLKGDVLAYLGKISSSYPSEQSQRIAKLGHLDLSNVKIASPPPSKQDALKTFNGAVSRPSRDQAAPSSSYTDIAVSISLEKVFEVQKRIHSTLGTTLPISTFIARATELANDDLPCMAKDQFSADDLFNAILGLDKVDKRVSRGHYIPQVTALPAAPTKVLREEAELDIIDILTSGPKSSSTKPPAMPRQGESNLSNAVDSVSVFSVSVRQGEEKRAKMFLERVKLILQLEPGRLIL